MIKPPVKKNRRTQKEIFLDKLKEISNGGQNLVTNQSLQSSLGWELNAYNNIKAQLLSERKIILGRGQGGRVGLSSLSSELSNIALKVFISYAHQDEAIKNDLEKHLSPLKRLNIIETWQDRKISAGDRWEDTINKNINDADIILLIISIDFINSKYCYETEMEIALNRSEAGETVIIPIIARNCMWKTTSFSHLQATPTDGKAISSWHDRDEALLIVAEHIKEVAERLISKKE